MRPIEIHRLRKRLKITQQQLADRIGAQRVTVARWEMGLNQPKGANLKLLKELIVKSKKPK
jgi:DNA-binding transcriptional regulator YiaG